MSYLDDLINEYRKEILNRESTLRRDYVRRWRKIETVLQGQVDALVLELTGLKQAGQPVPDYEVHQLARYRTLLAQAQEEIFRFMRYAEGSIDAAQVSAAQDGLDLGKASLEWIREAEGISLSFNHLNVEAVRAMIGYTQNGMPLFELLTADYPDSIVRLTDALTEGVARGYHPKKTAQMMMNAMAGNLQRAFSVARSEQMRSMRRSQLEEYRASGYVTEYERVATHDLRACLACLLEDGRIYQIDEEMSDHPHGRCLMMVKTRFFSGRTTGREYLLSLDREKQIEIMGAERYEAWVNGLVELEQMSRMVVDPVWGEAPRIVPMKELL